MLLVNFKKMRADNLLILPHKMPKGSQKKSTSPVGLKEEYKYSKKLSELQHIRKTFVFFVGFEQSTQNRKSLGA